MDRSQWDSVTQFSALPLVRCYLNLSFRVHYSILCSTLNMEASYSETQLCTRLHGVTSQYTNVHTDYVARADEHYASAPRPLVPRLGNG
jgi:hypothetical protein